jgi:hypothetical protein
MRAYAFFICKSAEPHSRWLADLLPEKYVNPTTTDSISLPGFRDEALPNINVQLLWEIPLIRGNIFYNVSCLCSVFLLQDTGQRFHEVSYASSLFR